MNNSTNTKSKNIDKLESMLDIPDETTRNDRHEVTMKFLTDNFSEVYSGGRLSQRCHALGTWFLNVIPLSRFKKMILFTLMLLIISFLLPEIRGDWLESTRARGQEVHGSFASRIPGTVSQAAEAGRAVVMEAMTRGSNPWEYLKSWMPDPAEAIALLARDKDVDDFEESSESEGEAGRHYGRVVELVPILRPIRDQAVTFFSEIHNSLIDAKIALPSDGSTGPITEKGKSWPPSRKNMDLAHTYALDIFLDPVMELPDSMLEVGPEILSASNGIVIASSSDWKGGAGIDTYKSGGISPNAGNGIIIFDPGTLRFYCYFHLFDTALSPGMPVTKGTVLGRGGDTGSNARKKGHGGHLHMEIFDYRMNRFLKNIEILELIF